MKVYNIQHNIGKARHVISFHDGEKTHNDGSPFFDIEIFKNKRSMLVFETILRQAGYKHQ